jgi:hypothetical protein
MSAEDAVKAREEAKKPKRPVVTVNVTVTSRTKVKPKPEPIIDDFESDVPELVPSGDE